MTLEKTIEECKKWIKIAGAIVVLSVVGPKAVQADDFAKGIRPPTGKQLEFRTTYQDGKFTLIQLPKYFNKEMGVVAVLPYDVTNGKAGDATFIAAALAKQGIINLMPHIAVTLPTGEDGSGAHALTYGVFSTLRPKDYSCELSIAAQYKIVGKDKQGKDLPNKYYVGTLVGVRIEKNLRLGAGLRHSNKGTELRFAAKYVLPKGWFAELHYALQKDKKPKIELQLRKNL